MDTILTTTQEVKPSEGIGTKDGIKFFQKEKVALPAEIVSQAAVQIPRIYYWEDVEQGQSVLMTMAFHWEGRNWGLSYPMLPEGHVDHIKTGILRNKLFFHVSQTLDILVHHGHKVMDSLGNINPRLVNDEEAIHWMYDKHWKNKTEAFKKLIKVYPINKKKAQKLRLL